MGNLFAGMTNGTTSLSYYTAGIETAGHNIANAGTTGYARQRVNVTENAAITTNGLTIGQGVSVSSITRVRNEFLDAQFRAQLASLGYWETRADAIQNLEYYSGQVAANNLGSAIDTFWTKMQDVSLYPTTSTYRVTLMSSAETMVSSLLGIRSQYDKYRYDINEQIYEAVDEANELIDSIALICDKIYEAKAKGENPNDLLDKRDLMAERLCKLTGATVSSPALDEADGEYKIDLHGKTLVQGGVELNCKGTAIKNTRHLVLVPMVGNFGYYDVQVEHDIFDHSSNYDVASVVMERQATERVCGSTGKDAHKLFVERLANGKTWQVGGAKGTLAGGERLDTIYDKNQALGLNGSFCLQVGTVGVQASSNSYATTEVATNGVILTAPQGDEATEYEFRIAAGEFESTVRIEYNTITGKWDITGDGGAKPLGASSGANGELTVADLQKSLSSYWQLDVSMDQSAQRLSIEASNTDEMRGHLLSITDIRGTLAADMGIANKNPAVEITVTEEDTLTTIANKINSAYMSELVTGDNAAYATNPPGTAPSSPEEWLHANIITEPDGSMYIALTSNVSGEAHRINVLPGSVCGANGDFSVARLLGFTDTGMDSTSYMQLNTSVDAKTTIIKNDVHVDDAYFIYDNVHYLSESNSFAEARVFKTTDAYGNVVRWDNPAADELVDFAKGIRLNLNGLNRYYDAGGKRSGNEATIISVSSHLRSGSIYALLECRDDMILGLEDQLDRLAYEMVTEVNALHYSGYGSGENSDLTGTAFFKHVKSLYGASRAIRVNAALSDTSLIATGSGDGTGKSKGEGDGMVAIMMAQLKTSKVFNSGTDDFNTYFTKFVSDYGNQGYEANYMLEAKQAINDQIEAQRDSEMGVSTDEEMIDIIKFQQGIGAISRYITALDDMLDRIINGMGRAGM